MLNQIMGSGIVRADKVGVASTTERGNVEEAKLGHAADGVV